MFAHVVDERTKLRLLQQHHAEELFQVVEANRAHLRAWLPWLDSTTEVQDSMDFIVMSIFTFAQQGPMVCGIWFDERLVGVIGHNDIDPDTRWAKLGYWLAADVEGKGVMTRCVTAFLDHGFTEYGLEGVEIRVGTENLRSQAIPDRLGFERGEVLVDAERLYDRMVDHRVNRMRREAWLGR
jgi:ribosomal-protein-serine acetyltransferase